MIVVFLPRSVRPAYGTRCAEPRKTGKPLYLKSFGRNALMHLLQTVQSCPPGKVSR